MQQLDGYQVYGFFRAGSSRIHTARAYIDRINVFPVPDGDTGTNLYSTVHGAVAGTIPVSSASITLGSLAEAALLSARGNSGVIFAQFITGLSEAVVGAEMRARDLAEGVRSAYLRAKSAVTTPRDGTILSVIDDWATALRKKAVETANLIELIGATRDDLKRSLNETTERLAELRAAGVVDAGAAGFVEFVEGGHEYLLRGAPVEGFETEAADTDLPEIAEAAPSSIPEFRFCTEAIVSGESIDTEAVRSALKPTGDSLIVAGARKRVKIHVHTNDPARVMETLATFGTVSGQKADDMVTQYRDAHDRASSTAIVTDSACDLPKELIERHRIHKVPLLIAASGSEYLDSLTLDASRLRTLSESKGAFPKTSQPPNHFFNRLYTNLASHYADIVSIHLSAALSGTFAASAKAAEQSEGKVVAFNSRNLSGSLGLIVLRAAEAAEAGANAEEIAQKLPEWAKKARIFVSVTSLRYMVKGGRVSPLKGFAAQVLNLKPIVSVDEEGKSILYGKAFSEKANLRKIVEMAVQEHERSPLRYYAVGHTGCPEKAADVAREMQTRVGFPPVYVDEISAVIALNAGPGAVSVVTMQE